MKNSDNIPLKRNALEVGSDMIFLYFKNKSLQKLKISSIKYFVYKSVNCTQLSQNDKLWNFEHIAV